jgi:hypothetical protein
MVIVTACRLGLPVLPLLPFRAHVNVPIAAFAALHSSGERWDFGTGRVARYVEQRFMPTCIV